MQSISLAIVSFLILFLAPDLAYAWGPATHLQFSLEILNNLALIAPSIAAIIGKHRNDFLYGAMAADIIVGKKFMIEYHHHCHNWKVGQKILNQASTEGQIACAYGYLSHLAADVISHNYFVPIHLIKSFNTKLLRHLYWEIRYDATIDHKVWALANKLAKEYDEANDELLEKMLKRTIFSFKTNKRIFNHFLIFQEVKHWRQMVDGLAALSSWKLDNKDVEDFKSLSLNNMYNFLLDPTTARCCNADPTGTSRLEYAKEVRKRLNKVKKSKNLSANRINQTITDFDLVLRQAIYDTKALPPASQVIA